MIYLFGSFNIKGNRKRMIEDLFSDYQKNKVRKISGMILENCVLYWSHQCKL